jgi:U5 small nuclear ribonucleoprotein component
VDEIDRHMSVKACPMSFVLPSLSGKSYLFNIMDAPGHVNFADEACAAMRLSDGVIVVVDAAEGVMCGTDRVLRYAVQERLHITLVINKVDRLILELKLPPADAYHKLKHTIEEVNAILAPCECSVFLLDYFGVLLNISFNLQDGVPAFRICFFFSALAVFDG